MLPNFKKNDSEPPKPPAPTNGASPPLPSMSRPAPGSRTGGDRLPPSIIGPDLTIHGNLSSKGQVQIDGDVQGDIHGTHVIVGERARITGGILADEIVVRGHVMGSIRGRRVMLQAQSHVEGDIYHQALAIEQGAYFEGKSRRSEDPTASPIDTEKPPMLAPVPYAEG
jgi:cytoskeletal protein CcmA (bactofilin family)